MSQVIRINTYQYDERSTVISRFRVCYRLPDALPFVDLFQVNTQRLLEAFHNQVGFQLRGVMSPSQWILKYTLRLWSGVNTMPVNISQAEYSPAVSTGVFDPSQFTANEPASQLSFARVRMASIGAADIEGDVYRRAMSSRAMVAREGIYYDYAIVPQMRTALQSLCNTLVNGLDVLDVPAINLPGFVASPVRAKFVYEDEPVPLNGLDPDATANDVYKGSQPVKSVSFGAFTVPVRRGNSDYVSGV